MRKVCFLLMLGSSLLPSPAFPKGLSLFYDRKEPKAIIPNFRTARSAFAKRKKIRHVPTREGLDQLRISASGQLSENEIGSLRNLIPPHLKLILLDLRREPHGFLNGVPISWNQNRKIKNDEHRLQVQQENLTYLSQQKELMVSDQKGMVYRILHPKLISETEVARKHRMESRRFPTKHHKSPPEELIQQFVSFVNELDPNTWVHFHCKAGSGRTTTYMIMFDMLHNADKVSKEDIILRHFLLGGANLRKHERYAAFRQLLDEFYLFAKKRLGGK